MSDRTLVRDSCLSRNWSGRSQPGRCQRPRSRSSRFSPSPISKPSSSQQLSPDRFHSRPSLPSLNLNLLCLNSLNCSIDNSLNLLCLNNNLHSQLNNSTDNSHNLLCLNSNLADSLNLLCLNNNLADSLNLLCLNSNLADSLNLLCLNNNLADSLNLLCLNNNSTDSLNQRSDSPSPFPSRPDQPLPDSWLNPHLLNRDNNKLPVTFSKTHFSPSRLRFPPMLVEPLSRMKPYWDRLMMNV